MNLEHTDKQLVASFFNQQPQPAFWMTPVFDNEQQIIDFEYRYCNEEFYHYTRLAPENVVGNRVFTSPAIADPNARKKLFDELLQVYMYGHRMQQWLYNPDLEKYYSYTRNKVEGGVLTVLQDRTEEYTMMRQLEEQKRLMDNILQFSSNAISVSEMIRNESGKIIDMKTILVNDAAVRLTGIPKEQYLAKTAVELDPNFVGSPYFNLCVQCMETGVPALTQYYLETPGRWMEVSVSKMDDNRQIYIFTDVTSIKQAQIDLERSANQLQTIINRAQSGIFTAAPVRNAEGKVFDFKFVIVNDTLASYLNQKAEDLVGETGSKWFTGYKTNGLFELFYDTYVNNKVNRFDFHYSADGIDAWMDMLCTRFDGEILVTFTDFTPVKKLQLETEELVEALKRSNTNLEEFAHAASHDLKEPIRKIHFFSTQIRGKLEGILGEEESRLFSRMENATERMGALVDDLLRYSYVSMTPHEMEQVDLTVKIRNVLNDLELLVMQKDPRIEIGPLPTINGYRRQLQQLFSNLIGNALKYSRPDVAPLIRITSRIVSGQEFEIVSPADREKQFHLVDVTDNGIGFEQENAEKIFQMFQRLHGKSEYSGTGVGLSIAKKVVENHNGYIWAESEPGKGATFRILLPV
jgi:signal transduction histidine kinase